MKKSVLSMILAVLMVLSVFAFASCGDNNDGKTPVGTSGTSAGTSATAGTSKKPTESTAPATAPEGAETSASAGGDIVVVQTSAPAGETTQASVGHIDDTVMASEVKELPEKDYNGDKVNVLMRTEYSYEFTEGSGDATIDEAVYNMVADVEDAYNMRFNFIDIPGGWGNRTSFVNAIHNSVLAEDQAYDLVFGYEAYMIDNMANGDFMNLLSLPYLQLGQDWWTQAGIDSLTLNGRCFIATGDACLSMWRSLFCMYFNKTIAAEYGINDIYDLVKSGDWTHDKFAEYVMMVSDDLNGDDVYDENDKFGLVCDSAYPRTFIVTYDTPIVAINGSDISMAWNNERTVKVVENLVTLWKTNNQFTSTANQTIFKDNHALFLSGTLGSSASFRTADVDFGIIPSPMLDKEQGAYYTTVGNATSMACVPVTVRDSEMSALMLEALARKGSEYVQPAFYESALKGKYARDNDSLEMIDTIRASLTFDFGWVHSVALNLGNSYQIFCDALDTDFASYYASRIDEYTENIKTIQSMYFD